VDGGARSAATGAKLPQLMVLAPDHVGLTLREQPDLFWYQSKPSKAEFQLTMIAAGIVRPVLRVKKPEAAGSGIMRIDLEKNDVRLRKDVRYQWSVALVVDAKNRSKDIVASGFLKRTTPNTRLSSRLLENNKGKLIQVYADSGIWYDAIETVSDMIDDEPKNKKYREWRAELLDQVGLSDPATFDRGTDVSKAK
jgi:hypothetical protein